MKLKIENTWTYVTCDKQEESWLFNFLTFETGQARFIPQFKGYVKPKVRLYSILQKRFPSGLLSMVTKEAQNQNLTVELEDTRINPLAQPYDLGWLGQDPRGVMQREAVAACLREHTGILWLPTGSGKTEIAIALALAAQGNWLFLVPDKDLLEQTAKRWEKITGLKAGRFGDGLWEHPAEGWTRFSVATFQTIYSKLKRRDPRVKDLLNSQVGVIADECHTLPADSFAHVMSNIDARYRIGLSGTPLARGDKRSLMAIAMTGPVIYRAKFEELAQAGILSRPSVQMHLCRQEGQASNNWHNTNKTWVVNSAERNQLLCEMAKLAKKPALLFINTIEHGLKLAKLLRAHKIECDFVWGQATSSMRENAIKRLKCGDTQVLICSTIFQQGVDIPALASVVMGGGGASTIATIQKVGRGMRTNEGSKMTFEVWDVLDSGVSTLTRHAVSRKRAYTNEGYEVKVIK